MHDTLQSGHKFRLLTAIDDCTRECLFKEVRQLTSEYRLDCNQVLLHGALGYLPPSTYAQRLQPEKISGPEKSRSCTTAHSGFPL